MIKVGFGINLHLGFVSPDPACPGQDYRAPPRRGHPAAAGYEAMFVISATQSTALLGAHRAKQAPGTICRRGKAKHARYVVAGNLLDHSTVSPFPPALEETLSSMKQTKEQEEQRYREVEERLKQQEAELETLRRKRSRCTIL